MSKDFEVTPSFFNNEETFEKYLGNTSYYLGLQNNVLKIIKLAKSKKVLEFGSATGSTSILIAEKFSDVAVVGVDMREDVVQIAKDLAQKKGVDNVEFKVGDMLTCAKEKIDADFVLMLYSFHHIVDPLDNKIDFLKNLYNSIQKGTYVCIAETFIPDGVKDRDSIINVWSIRKDEGFASTFWSSLDSLSQGSIERAISIGEYCAKNEYLAGELVADRNEEYLIEPTWLIEQATNAGFKVIINQPINIIEDRIILLQK